MASPLSTANAVSLVSFVHRKLTIRVLALIALAILISGASSSATDTAIAGTCDGARAQEGGASYIACLKANGGLDAMSWTQHCTCARPYMSALTGCANNRTLAPAYAIVQDSDIMCVAAGGATSARSGARYIALAIICFTAVSSLW